MVKETVPEDQLFGYFGGEEEGLGGEPSGLIVFLEVDENRVKDASLEALGKARELADTLGVYVSAILPREDEGLARGMFFYGADRLLIVEGEGYDWMDWVRRLAAIVESHNPEVLLLAATPYGKSLAGCLAQRLKTGLVGGCTALEIDTGERLLLMTRPLYGGKLMECSDCPRGRPQIASLRPVAFPLPLKDESRSGEIIRLTKKS